MPQYIITTYDLIGKYIPPDLTLDKINITGYSPQKQFSRHVTVLELNCVQRKYRMLTSHFKAIASMFLRWRITNPRAKYTRVRSTTKSMGWFYQSAQHSLT